MQFTKVLLTLGLVAGITASPVALEEKRQQSAPQIVSSIVFTLKGNVNTNLATISMLHQPCPLLDNLRCFWNISTDMGR